MKQLIVFLLLFSPGLYAKRPLEPDDRPVRPINVHKTHVKNMLEKYPGAKELPGRRGKDVVVLQLPDETVETETTTPGTGAPPVKSTGKRTKYLATFGRGQTYQDPDTGAWLLAEPTLSATNRGWVMLGSRVDIVVRRMGNTHEVEQIFNDPDTKADPSVAITYPALTYQQEKTFSFQKDGLEWKLKLGSDGSEFTALVSQRMGTKTFRFPFRQRLTNLRPGPDGNLVGDFSFSLARAITVGADHEVRPCSAWQVTANEISFSCDDSSFPAEAFPYVIDPTTQFTRPGYNDEINQNPAANSYTLIQGNGNFYGIGNGVFSMGNAWGRYNREMFFRWDTSGLPDDAEVSGATMTLWAGGHAWSNGTNFGANTVTYPFYFYWYPNSLFPQTSADARHGDDANSIYAGYWGPRCACSGGYYSPSLTDNLTNISRTGYTAVRWKNLGSGFGAFYDFYVSGYSMDFTLKLNVTYTVNEPPVTVSVSGLPAHLNIGQWFTVTATVRDPNGYADINYWHLLLNYGVDGAYACYFLIYHRSNYFHVINDVSTDWGAGHTFGTANDWFTNGSCQVDVQNSTLTNSGTDSTASFRLRFLRTVLQRPDRPDGNINSYLWVGDLKGTGPGWQGPYTSSTAHSGPKLIVVIPN